MTQKREMGTGKECLSPWPRLAEVTLNNDILVSGVSPHFGFYYMSVITCERVFIGHKMLPVLQGSYDYSLISVIDNYCLTGCSDLTFNNLKNTTFQ